MSGYNLICRICLLQTQNLKEIDSKMFRYCIGISNSSSSKICKNCDKDLRVSYLFKKKCIEANKMYTQYWEYKIEVLTDNIITEIDIEKEVQEAIEDKEIIQTCKEEEFKDNTQIDDKEILQTFKEEEFEVNSQFEITLPDENESDYFLSEDEYFLKQITIDPPAKLQKREFELCYICGDKRYSSTTLEAHIKNMHSSLDSSSKVKSFSCDKCEKAYASKDHLNQHIRAHHQKIKAYACSICDKTFLYWNSRKCHMVSAHGAEPRHHCHICPYKTDLKSRLKQHINGHTGELPFECEICEKRFINKGQMVAHMIVHTKTKNHICPYCSKAFGTAPSMKSHIKIHTQERNYVCPVESCGKDFIQNHVLKSHIKANHPDVEIPPPGTIVSKKYKNLTVNKILN